MKHRVFIAINLPENLKKRLGVIKQEYGHLPLRWVKENSLHLTLAFIGYVSNEQLGRICETTRRVAENFKPFDINLTKIVLAPTGKKTPRFIWLEGESNKDLDKLNKRLEENLAGVDSGFCGSASRFFKPHITLARVSFQSWRRLEKAPLISEEFNARVFVESVEVMESDLKRDGAEYAVMESCKMKQEHNDFV